MESFPLVFQFGFLVPSFQDWAITIHFPSLISRHWNTQPVPRNPRGSSHPRLPHGPPQLVPRCSRPSARRLPSVVRPSHPEAAMRDRASFSFWRAPAEDSRPPPARSGSCPACRPLRAYFRACFRPCGPQKARKSALAELGRPGNRRARLGLVTLDVKPRRKHERVPENVVPALFYVPMSQDLGSRDRAGGGRESSAGGRGGGSACQSKETLGPAAFAA